MTPEEEQEILRALAYDQVGAYATFEDIRDYFTDPDSLREAVKDAEVEYLERMYTL